MHAWLKTGGAPDQLLPQNLTHLVTAVLAQQRAIEDVQVATADRRQLLWTFFPLVEGHVLGRARDATDTLQTYQQAQVARRLYRLIIENTTDLISRHRPAASFSMPRRRPGRCSATGRSSCVAPASSNCCTRRSAMS